MAWSAKEASIGVCTVQITDAQAYASWHRAANRTNDRAGPAILKLAERWANLMEPRLADGKNIADIGMDTLSIVMEGSDALDPGTMLGDVAADFLEECWLHGKAFRRWYGASRWRI